MSVQIVSVDCKYFYFCSLLEYLLVLNIFCFIDCIFLKVYKTFFSWGGIVTINKSLLYGFVYSYRVPQLFYPFSCLTYRYWSVMGFTWNILCSLLDCYKYPYILLVSQGPQ